MRRLGKALLISGVTYAVVCAGVWIGMHWPPADFARVAAHVPAGVLFAAIPAETLWKSARAGRLRPGDLAPDFRLPTVDRTSEVRLSSHRGDWPVMLIFGSYT